MRPEQICDAEAGNVAKFIFAASRNNPQLAIMIAETVLAALIGAQIPPDNYDQALTTLGANMKNMMEQQRLARATPTGEA